MRMDPLFNRLQSGFTIFTSTIYHVSTFLKSHFPFCSPIYPTKPFLQTHIPGGAYFTPSLYRLLFLTSASTTRFVMFTCCFLHLSVLFRTVLRCGRIFAVVVAQTLLSLSGFLLLSAFPFWILFWFLHFLRAVEAFSMGAAPSVGGIQGGGGGVPRWAQVFTC